jgi:hypothetical protein
MNVTQLETLVESFSQLCQAKISEEQVWAHLPRAYTYASYLEDIAVGIVHILWKAGLSECEFVTLLYRRSSSSLLSLSRRLRQKLWPYAEVSHSSLTRYRSGLAALRM